MDDEDFSILYLLETIPNYPAGNQLPYQEKNNILVLEIYGEEIINAKVSLEELQ